MDNFVLTALGAFTDYDLSIHPCLGEAPQVCADPDVGIRLSRDSGKGRL